MYESSYYQEKKNNQKSPQVLDRQVCEFPPSFEEDDEKDFDPTANFN